MSGLLKVLLMLLPRGLGETVGLVKEGLDKLGAGVDWNVLSREAPPDRRGAVGGGPLNCNGGESCLQGMEH